MYLRVIYKHRSETTDEKEQIKHVHCCDNHPNKNCSIATITYIVNMQELSKEKMTTNVLSMFADIAEDCGEGGGGGNETNEIKV